MKKGLYENNLYYQNRMLKLIIVILVSAFTLFSFMYGNSEQVDMEDEILTNNLYHTTFNLNQAKDLTKNYRAATTNKAFAFQITEMTVNKLKELLEADNNIGGFRCYYAMAENENNYYLIYRALDENGEEMPRSDDHEYTALTIPSDYGSSNDGFPYAFPCPDFCDRDNGSERDPYKFTNNRYE